jgi:hypothetical protein
MEKLPYLLVAEKSLLKIIAKTVSALEKHANPAVIYVVVPGGQLEAFRAVLTDRILLVPEEDVLPEWPLARVKSMLPKQPARAGWYLQQFLKLGFGKYTGVARYVIWDADTVMLQPPVLERIGRVVMNTAKEYHQPYFDTFRRLFGVAATLPRSMISQYMLIDSAICLQMEQEICARGLGEDWIDVLLRGLHGTSISEFSEYETYANYLAHINPSGIELQTSKWFRYGSEIFPDPESASLEQIEKRFAGYDYVALERHRSNPARWLGARFLLMLNWSA